jgi:hypothetical protein
MGKNQKTIVGIIILTILFATTAQAFVFGFPFYNIPLLFFGTTITLPTVAIEPVLKFESTTPTANQNQLQIIESLPVTAVDINNGTPPEKQSIPLDNNRNLFAQTDNLEYTPAELTEPLLEIEPLQDSDFLCAGLTLPKIIFAAFEIEPKYKTLIQPDYCEELGQLVTIHRIDDIQQILKAFRDTLSPLSDEDARKEVEFVLEKIRQNPETGISVYEGFKDKVKEAGK